MPESTLSKRVPLYNTSLQQRNHTVRIDNHMTHDLDTQQSSVGLCTRDSILLSSTRTSCFYGESTVAIGFTASHVV
jgi:hypothetical protein